MKRFTIAIFAIAVCALEQTYGEYKFSTAQTNNQIVTSRLIPDGSDIVTMKMGLTDGTNTIDASGEVYKKIGIGNNWTFVSGLDQGAPVWRTEEFGENESVSGWYFQGLDIGFQLISTDYDAIEITGVVEFMSYEGPEPTIIKTTNTWVRANTAEKFLGKVAMTNDAVAVVMPSTNATNGTAADARDTGIAIYTGFTDWKFSDGLRRVVLGPNDSFSGGWWYHYLDEETGYDITSATFPTEVEALCATNLTFGDVLFATRHLVTPTRTSQLENDSKFVVSNDYIIVGTNNTTISSSPNIIGSNIQMGSMAWYYSTIVFSQNVANKPATIYLTDDKSKRNTGLVVTNESFHSGYVVGDVISIVNKAKYDNKCSVTAVVGNVIDVDTIPFTRIVNGQNDYDDYTVTSTNKPTFGIVSIGDNSFATGTGHKVYRVLDTVFGRDNSAIGDYALVGGRNNIGAYGAFAAGRDNIAIGQYSTAVGSHTEALADRAHAEGYYTMASGNSSHTEGMMTAANGMASHVEGSNTLASVNATFAHAEGQNTYVDARGAHVEGVGASGKDQSKYGAQAVASHVEGTRCFVVKDAIGAHAEGLETIASNTYEHAQGRYNLTHYQTNSFGYAGNTLHSIGKGVSAKARSNAVEVMQTGTVFVYGVGGYDGTNPTGSGVKDLASVLNERHFTNVVVETGKWTLSGISDGDIVTIQWEDTEWYIPLFANGQSYELYVNGSLEDTSLTCDYNNATPPTNLIVTATRPYYLGITLRPYTTTIASWNDNSDIRIDIDKTTQSIVRECKLTLVADVDFSIVWDTTKFYKVQSSESIANGTTNIFSFTEFMPDKFIVTKQTIGGSGN